MKQSRRMLVLRAVVEDYIRTREPIGSTAVARSHDIGVSSATIRNDMAVLEDEGYLIQPHTSAGRIPTEKGYRFFVDRLATIVPLSDAQRRGIRAFLAGSVNMQDTLQRAARLLSSITGQVAVVASPSLTRSRIRHIELLAVGSYTAMAIVITDTGRVAQHLLVLQHPCDDAALSRAARIATQACRGQALRHAASTLSALPSSGEEGVDEAFASLSPALETMADEEHASDLYMSGVSRLAQQNASDDLAPLFDALEEQVVLMRLMTTLSEAEGPCGVGVAIGSETHTPGLMHASVISTGYGQAGADEPRKDQAPVAFVGSIGPTHMDYAATMAAVGAVATYLTEYLDPAYAGERDETPTNKRKNGK